MPIFNGWKCLDNTSKDITEKTNNLSVIKNAKDDIIFTEEDEKA